MNGRSCAPGVTVRPLLAGLLASSLLIGCSPVPRVAGASPSAPTTAEVRAACDLSAGYMERSVGADGRFAYLVDMDPDVDVSPSYNILRHAGSTWAMCDRYGSRPTARMGSSIERAGAYLRDRRVRALPDRGDLLAVWSYSEDDGDAPSAKLGGTGLGLVALTGVERIRPGSAPLSTLRALGRFIVFMQRSDGSFYTQYVPSRGGRVTTPPSLFYPGEAALGLLMLYEVDPQPVWIQSAAKALEYLARSRVDESDPPADHWALIATQRLMQSAPKAGDQVRVDEELLTGHVVQVCESILRDQVGEGGDPRYVGGFSTSGGTTATSTRLEGLQAALGALPEGHESRPRIRTSVEAGMAFLLRAQVAEGEYAGAFPHHVGSTEVRIDYVQHALSAMMRYAGERPGISRLAGATRYDTAIAVSRAGWPTAVDGVVIATGANYPDAITAAPLAKAYGGPVLLTTSASLGSALTAELKRLAPRHVFIAGGTGVVSGTVGSQLAALPSRPAVVRCGGIDRYGTAALIARQVAAKVSTTPKVVVCAGTDFSDGLSVASLAAAQGWPMLLAKGGALTPATESALADLAPSSSLLVGTTTRLPETIEPLVPAPTRVSGADGPATSVAVAAWARANGHATLAGLGLASSSGFPDALAAGPYLARDGGMLLLTPPASLPPATASFLEANKGAVARVEVVGGSGAVPETVVYQVGTALR